MEKDDFDIWNQHTRICLSAKNCTKPKKKKKKFGTKNALFGYILGCKFDKVLSYLESASSNLSKCQN